MTLSPLMKPENYKITKGKRPKYLLSPVLNKYEKTFLPLSSSQMTF